MSYRLAIRFTARVARQVEQAGRWWRDNRPKAPGAIREELDRALELLAVQLLSRINYHLYYRIRGTPPDGIEVLAFWHGSRRAPPSL